MMPHDQEEVAGTDHWSSSMGVRFLLTIFNRVEEWLCTSIKFMLGCK